MKYINVINGLSREQVVAFRELAQQVNIGNNAQPNFSEQLCPEFNKVRAVYLELRTVLLENRPVTEELMQKVVQARL